MDEATREYLSEIGKRGGSKTGPTKARSKRQARKAGKAGAKARWAKVYGKDGEAKG
jgi:general stress protein YciG